jgi:hypothetical protein
MGGLPGHKQELRSGDTTNYFYTPKVVQEVVRGVSGDLVVHDAIGRRFRAPAGALATALATSRPPRS